VHAPALRLTRRIEISVPASRAPLCGRGREIVAAHSSPDSRALHIFFPAAIEHGHRSSRSANLNAVSIRSMPASPVAHFHGAIGPPAKSAASALRRAASTGIDATRAAAARAFIVAIEDQATRAAKSRGQEHHNPMTTSPPRLCRAALELFDDRVV